MKILALGDVIGDGGIGILEKSGRLRKLRDSLSADLVIANGENSYKKNGMTPDSAARLLESGVDIITGGNHTWKQNSVFNTLDDNSSIIRPANYPDKAPGMGWTITEAAGRRVLVINVAGCIFMDEPVTPPAGVIESIMDRQQGKYDIAVCDVHAEATSEKMILARLFDGRLSAVFGTHTHVQTADEQILPGGTGFISDLGMCGSENGILGVKSECVIKKYTEMVPVAFEHAEGSYSIRGALFTIDPGTAKCTEVERIYVRC